MEFHVECGNVMIEQTDSGTWLSVFDDTGAEQSLALEPNELILIQECIGRWEDKVNQQVKAK